MTDNCRLFYFMCIYRKIYNLYYVYNVMENKYAKIHDNNYHRIP